MFAHSCIHQHNFFWNAINDYMMSKNFRLLFCLERIFIRVLPAHLCLPVYFYSFFSKPLPPMQEQMYFPNGPQKQTGFFLLVKFNLLKDSQNLFFRKFFISNDLFLPKFCQFCYMYAANSFLYT